MLIEIIILFVTLILLWDYLSKKRRNDMLSYMGGPKPLPIVGNVLAYRGQNPEGKPLKSGKIIVDNLGATVK